MTEGPAPRFATPRSLDRPTHGGAAAKVAQALGKPFMPWQQLASDVGLEYDPDTGLYVYSTVIVTVQRQSGKTTLVMSVGTHRCLTVPRGRVWYTAQTGQAAGEWLREEAIPVLDGSLFRGRFKTRLSQGSESIQWAATGSTFRCFPPLRDALHGKQSDLVFPDEAWAHNEVVGDALKQAIRPTQATRPGAQTWPLSTAGDADSAYLRSYVDLGRASVAADRREGVAYIEYGIPDDVDPDDVEQVAKYHPAVGFTIGIEALRAAHDELKPGEFARAYGNRWTSTTERVIPAAEWADAGIPADLWTPPEVGKLALGFEVALDRSEAVVTASWRAAPDGPRKVDVLAQRPGTAWVRDLVLELRDRWKPTGIGYYAAGPGTDVADELQRAGARLEPMNTTEYRAACAGFLADVITPGRLQHPDHPRLNAAVDAAAQRITGEGWTWGPRQSAGSIAALVGATVAGWTYDHAKAPVAPVIVAARRRLR